MATQTEMRVPDSPRGLYVRDGIFRFKRMVRRKNIVIPLGDSLAEALAEAARLKKKIELGIDPALDRRQDCTTVESFIETFKSMKPGWRERTAQRYAAIFGNFVYWLTKRFGHAPRMIDITYEVAQDYISARKAGAVIPDEERKKLDKFNRPYSGQSSKWTVRMERDTLAGVFREAVKRELIRKNPFDEVKVERPSNDDKRAVHRILSEPEQVALLETCREIEGKGGNAGFADILLFLLKTGLREDELRKLEWTDVDLSEGVIHIRKKRVIETRRCFLTDNALKILKALAKGKKPKDALLSRDQDWRGFSANRLPIRSKRDLLAIRVGDINWNTGELVFRHEYDWDPKATNGAVPLGKTALNLLSRLHKDKKSNFVFVHHDGGSCRLDLLGLLKKAQVAAGITGRLRLHDTRHTRAAYLRRKGVPLETIMGLLRHASIEETMVYAPYDLKEGQKAVAEFD